MRSGDDFLLTFHNKLCPYLVGSDIGEILAENCYFPPHAYLMSQRGVSLVIG